MRLREEHRHIYISIKIGLVNRNQSFRGLGLGVVVVNATFTNQLYRGDQFYWCGQTGVPGENYQPTASH